MTVHTPGGTAGAFFKFGTTPANPTITSVTPSTGPAAGGNSVTITGTNFVTSGVGATSFTFFAAGESGPATSVNCTNTTTGTATVPFIGNGGVADVQVQVTYEGKRVQKFTYTGL